MVSALGFASNIVQLLDSIPSTQAMKDFTESLIDDIGSSNSRQRTLTRHEEPAHDAAERCGKEAASLLGELERLKVERSSSKVKTRILAVARSLRAASKRDALETRRKRLCKLES